jgi:hypothetical protein
MTGRSNIDTAAKDWAMTLGNFSFWSWGKPKPLNARGTRAAFLAGSRVYKQKGVNPHLKQAVKASLKNARRKALADA